MNVTKDIVKDLLPLYIAGEASADSRALVESCLREHEDLARLAEALRAGEVSTLASPPIPQGQGRAALEQTKALLRRRTWLKALALFFTGLPLSCAGSEHGLEFLLLRDAPVAASLSLAVAAALWIAYAATVRRTRVTGL